MSKPKNLLALLLCVFVLCSGCANTLVMRSASWRETTWTEAAVETPRPDGYGTLCIYRPKGFAGCGSNILILHNMFPIGASGCGSYFYVHMPAGKQTVWAEFMHIGKIEVDVVAGQTTYLLFDFTSDFIEGAYPFFIEKSEQQAKEEMKGFQYISYKPLR